MDKEKINAMLDKGYACSQVVLGYFADRYGLDKEKAKKIAAAFESGQMQGNICGAVNAGYMVLGLEYSNDDPENRAFMIGKVREFNEAFTEKRGSIVCKDLLGGKEIHTDEGMKEVLDEGLLEKVCQPAMVSAIEILEEMIEK